MFKFGDVRADGFVFRGYHQRKGRQYEHWLSPQAAAKKRAAAKRWKRKNYAAKSAELSAQSNAWQKERRRRDPIPDLLTRARLRAKQYGVPFSLTRDDVHIPTHCPVFGCRLVVGGGDTAPSLDRIEPAEGYVPGNVVVVSYAANRAKGNLTRAQIRALAAFYG